MKGPAIFIAQFLGNEAPYDTLENLCEWAKDNDYKAIQIPVWETKLFDLQKIATDKIYAQEYKANIKSYGLEISDLSTHLIGQLIAVHPAYDLLFDGFAPESVRNNPSKRTEWAIQQMKWAAEASKNLGLTACATFSGALLWHTMYPWPQRPSGLVEEGFSELAKRWIPILDHFDKNGIDLCYETHAGEDIFDGTTFDLFLDAVKQHPRANLLYDPSHFILQGLKYLDFIDIYHSRIKMFHVKDAEFNPTGRQGVYGGYQDWANRAGRFRSLGDGQVDFKSIFSKLTHYGYDGWAVLEWECCIKDKKQGAKEGAEFIKNHLISKSKTTFDDFAKVDTDKDFNRKVLGL